MDYEKLYKEAIARIRKYTKDEYGCTRLKPEDIFPELAESEDERIRKHLIGVVELYYGNTDEQEKKDCLAWLEKQAEQESYASETMNEKGDFDNGFTRMMEKEQKPAWSEEDEKQARQIERIVHDDGCSKKLQEQIANWFKSLKDRVQRKQDWSEEDKAILEKCIGAVKVSCYSYSFKSEAENWLKSLRPQKKWEPSEEQMKVLNEVINFAADHGTMRWNDYIYNVLKSLREQLKNL